MFAYFHQNGGYCVNIIDSNVFHNMHSIENWGISLRYSPVLAEGYSVM